MAAFADSIITENVETRPSRIFLMPPLSEPPTDQVQRNSRKAEPLVQCERDAPQSRGLVLAFRRRSQEAHWRDRRPSHGPQRLLATSHRPPRRPRTLLPKSRARRRQRRRSPAPLFARQSQHARQRRSKRRGV